MTSHFPPLHGLQGLRGVAALLVVIGHAITEAAQQGSQALPLPFPWASGVDVFFVISGFIMTLTNWDHFGSPSSTREFIWRRIVRIVPLYWIYTAAMVAALIFVGDRIQTAVLDPWNVISSILFIPYQVADGTFRPILALGWTLNYEMFFYALFSACLLLNRASGLILMYSALMALVVGGYLFGRGGYGVFYFWSNPIILEFGLGMMCGVAFRIFGHREEPWPFCFLTASAILGLTLGHDHVESRFFVWGIPSFAIVLAFTMFIPNSVSRFSKSWLKLVGDSSYSLYLSHPFTLAILVIFWNGSDSHLFVALAVVLSIVVGAISYYCLERPLISLGKPRSKLRAL
jgi:exopolysaccharide production protein ExoZ